MRLSDHLRRGLPKSVTVRGYGTSEREVQLEAPGQTVVGVERCVAGGLVVRGIEVGLGLGHLPEAPVAPAISTRPLPGIRPCVTSALPVRRQRDLERRGNTSNRLEMMEIRGAQRNALAAHRLKQTPN